MDQFRIIGAGLAGLLAACRFPQYNIYEQRDRDSGPNHKALLRFRSDEVSQLTGIPFRQVRVDKSIWDGEKHLPTCNIAAANAYSRKVLGKVVAGRSIWNLNPDQRWIAPEDFEQTLIDRFDRDARIAWGYGMYNGAFERGDKDSRTISTIPMPAMLDVCDIDKSELNFSFKSNEIRVCRYRLEQSTDVYQTVYFPSEYPSMYRASITGNLLIVEAAGDKAWDDANNRDEACKAFDIDCTPTAIDSAVQKFGKITDMPKAERGAVLYELTREFNIFSVGRFATWRNILLDDVVKDLDFIAKLIDSTEYARQHIFTKSHAMMRDDDSPF